MLADDSKLLEEAFELFNEVYFENCLPNAVITIQSSPRCYGYISGQKVWRSKDDSYHEINIGAEYLARPIQAVLATLCHEMVHLYCMCLGISETSCGGRYHNKRFKVEAEKRDLKISYAKYIGYSVTEPSDRFVEVLREHGFLENIDHCRTTGFNTVAPPVGGDDNGSAGGDMGKKKTSTRKYMCNNCGISVRATKDVFIICGDCMEVMVKVD